uniref:Receptor protein kinase-like n=1 Tax=Oryza sativa subsp. japonica TaxID=39947 RepID=Q654Z6_ORYSJ|nr:receptor protein kinase-like [Oryza sativa Japonica Group]
MESSSLWGVLGQASNVAQLVGVDALGLVSMVAQAALAARRHRDACRRLGQHAELVGGLLRELELAELMRREATRRPLEQLQGALRRCYALATACQEDGGYLHRLLLGARMADELRAAQHEIDMYIRLIPLIALVDSSSNHRDKAMDGAATAIKYSSNRHIRFPARVSGFTEIHVQGDTKLCNAGEQPLGTVYLQEQKILDIEELVELCTRTEESCPGFSKFDFSQIVHATDNFSENSNIGRGGFATVYKLARVQHNNLVKLLGWCIHGKERILVYEFADRGSLQHYIFDKMRKSLLDWPQRVNIIKGVAEGLVYLHKLSMLWIVHRDLKPDNILLDYNMNPKISDFGSSSSLSSEVAEEHTRRVVGTSGFKAPEYASRGVYSVKTDVFSFGVLVLVIISGRKNSILYKQRDAIGDLVRDVLITLSNGREKQRVFSVILDYSINLKNIRTKAWHMWRDGRLHELVDPSLGNVYELDQIIRCTQVALLCTQEDPTVRPTMPDVAAMLSSGSVILLDDPKKPSELSNEVEKGGDETSTCMDQSSQTIDITITSSAPVSTRVRIIIDQEII